MQRSICGIHSTVAAQQRRSTAFATSHPAKHCAANFTVTIRVATYSRVTGNTEVGPRPQSAWRKRGGVEYCRGFCEPRFWIASALPTNRPESCWHLATKGLIYGL